MVRTKSMKTLSQLLACCWYTSCWWSLGLSLAPNVCERQSEGAWFMHFRVTMMVCDLVASATIMQKHKRMPAAFRSLT